MILSSINSFENMTIDLKMGMNMNMDMDIL